MIIGTSFSPQLSSSNRNGGLFLYLLGTIHKKWLADSILRKNLIIFRAGYINSFNWSADPIHLIEEDSQTRHKWLTFYTFLIINRRKVSFYDFLKWLPFLFCIFASIRKMDTVKNDSHLLNCYLSKNILLFEIKMLWMVLINQVPTC